ncbi:biotin synthase [Ideonella sp. 4Y16]|uniref:methyltransferase domain-containing protein n=1 Tax=Ideonella alba TaxID=2824118 RepID=UPI001B366255|nr:methyltransferase domain-containing protein [Ideonella alba]MBQ0945314.1 biotin synthase [Ideonella alba]
MSTSPAPRALDARTAQRVQGRQQRAGAAPWLHAESARRLAERLVVFRQAPRRVLDLSGSAGGPASVLAEACPGAQIDRAGAPPPGGRWWQRLLTPAPTALADGEADLLWSVMQLHWAADPPALLADWRRRLAPQGALMFSTLGPGTLDELRQLYSQAGWGSPMAPLVDMHDLGDMLVAAGYEGPVMDQETLTLTWSSPEALLAELRELGANADPARFSGLRTPSWRQRLLDALSARADAQGRIALRLELVYGHAIRGLDRGPAVSAEVRIGLDDMSAMLRNRPKR